jgi:SAM-dependent methyltransferase
MSETDKPEKPDKEYWAGRGGENWTRHNSFTESLFSPVTAVLLAAAAAKPGERAVDVGCGCGGTALALAKQVGQAGFVLGIDVSAAMLGLARRLAPPGARAEFVEADATTHVFAKPDFDLLCSRHGVMFFDDPARAFANLRKALKPGGRMAFSCFRAPKDNPWAMVPVEAIYAHVPRPPKLGPEDPSPFAFADPARVQRILGGAGFAGVSLTPHDLAFDIAAGGGLDAAVENMLEIGPASRAVANVSAATRAKVAAAAREALAPYAKGNAVALGSAIWIVTAKNP